MKITANVECTDGELRELLADGLRRVFFEGAKLLGAQLDGAFTPEATRAVLSVLSQLGPLVAGPGPQARPVGPPYGDLLGGLGVPSGPGAWRRPAPRGPFAPPGPQPYPPPPPPERSTSPVVEHCVPIEPSRLYEQGWACCQCGGFNAAARAACRLCGHERCGVAGARDGGAVVTPPAGASQGPHLPNLPEESPS